MRSSDWSSDVCSSDLAADRIRECLEHEVSWEVSQRADLALESPLPAPREDDALLRAAYARAREGFEFVFDRYRMVEALRDGRDPGLLLHVVLDFLNSPQFIEIGRAHV